MSARMRAFALPVAATAAYLTFAVSALAGTTSISGSVPNGGCDAARPVPVSGPSRIEVAVSSTSSSNDVLGEIIAPDGNVVASGSYDTPGGGNYAVQVCSLGAGMNPPQIQYDALIGTGPSGQPVLQGPAQPAPSGGVLGASTALASHVSGKGAIQTRSGLAWFTVSIAPDGTANVVVFDPAHRKRSLMKGMNALFGTNSVSITGNGLKLVLVDQGTNDRITFSSKRFKASGNVIRGGFQIMA
jgi:hypothetical protein